MYRSSRCTFTTSSHGITSHHCQEPQGKPLGAIPVRINKMVPVRKSKLWSEIIAETDSRKPIGKVTLAVLWLKATPRIQFCKSKSLGNAPMSELRLERPPDLFPRTIKPNGSVELSIMWSGPLRNVTLFR